MDNQKEQKLLFQEFESVSTEKWEELIKKDLKGADYSKKLVWKTLDGVSVKPYYRTEDLQELPETGVPGEFPFVRGSKVDNNDWLIRQNIVFSDSDSAATKVNLLREKGVQSVGVSFAKSPEKEVLIDFLNAIPLDNIEINFKGVDPVILLELLNDYCAETKVEKNLLRGSLGLDPIGDLTRSGRSGNLEDGLDQVANVIKLAREFENLRVFEVDAKLFHNSGSTAVQELAFAMSVATEYMDALTERELNHTEISSKLTFNFAVGSNYFFELAKFRSAKQLWSGILESYMGKAPEKVSFIHAETSVWNTTVYDPYVNLLRTTTEAMSSVLGGVDSLTVLQFNQSFEEATELSERLARNQQIILKEEAYLDKVVDPAAGSYYIENLTSSLSAEGWKIFQATEETGGFIDSFMKGLVQDAIVTVAQKRDMRIAQRRDILLGTNQYANQTETILEDIDEKVFNHTVADPTDANTQPLIPYRGAEGFETLRMDTEKAEKQPVVFLLNIGNLTMRKARAAFASNFFGCAGYKVIDNLGFSSVEEGMEEALKVKADIVVLCSSDDEYAQYGPEAAEANGDAELVVAGYPAAIMDQLNDAGICHFIHVKTNLLETLRGFNQLMGISQ